jgi:hypothetical protein
MLTFHNLVAVEVFKGVKLCCNLGVCMQALPIVHTQSNIQVLYSNVQHTHRREGRKHK